MTSRDWRHSFLGGLGSRTALKWALRLFLAAFFVMAALPKLAGVPLQVQMFDQIGMGQWLRYFVGTAELSGGLGLLVRPLLRPAAAGLALDMAVASVVNVAILHSPAVAMTVPLYVVLTALAYTGARATTRVPSAACKEIRST